MPVPEVLFRRSGPGRSWCMSRLVHPGFLKRQSQPLSGHPTARTIMPVRRPVLSGRNLGKQDKGKTRSLTDQSPKFHLPIFPERCENSTRHVRLIVTLAIQQKQTLVPDACGCVSVARQLALPLSSRLPPANHCRVLAGLVERRPEPNPRARIEPRAFLGFFEGRERCHLQPFHAQEAAFFASQPFANEREAHPSFNPENGRFCQYFPVLSRREGILECPLFMQSVIR